MSFRNDDDIVSTFLSEVEDHLSVIEVGILEMENPEKSIDEELIHTMFRSAHSIKAGANLLEYSNIEAIAHMLENILQKIKHEKSRLDNALVSDFLAGLDLIGELTGNIELSDMADISPTLNNLRKLLDE